MKTPVKLAIVAGVMLVFGVLFWEWGFCRRYVAPGHMLVITSNFGTPNSDPANLRVVPDGYQGVWETVRGEGRHFYNPISYTVDTTAAVVVVPPGKVGLIVASSGKPLPGEQFLAEVGYKGVQRRVLTPGSWRLNPAAFKVTILDAIEIHPGYVGCVTSLAGTNPPEGQLADEGQRGLRRNVLQPGLYFLNPREFKVDEIEVGYSQITFSGVTFPSKDGFTIKIDVSVVYGFLPKDVPMILNRFGSVEAVVDKIIRPQVESICRIEGSKYGAKDFIEGESRELFQTTFTQSIVREAKSREIEEKAEELQRFRNATARDLGRERDRTARDILKAIQDGVDSYAKANGFTLVLDSRSLLYATPAQDVTDGVLKLLNGPAAAKPKP